MYNRTHNRSASDASNISNWSCDSNNDNLLQSILINSSQNTQPTVKFSNVHIVNDSATAYIAKDSSLPGSTKNVIDRYYSN
ncbi:unnamed protein product [Mucor hiemalis]